MLIHCSKSYINTPSALHPLCEHPAVLGVEMGGVVADRGVARWRCMVRMRAVRAMRAHPRRLLPKIRPKASSSTGQHGRSRTRAPGERTNLGGNTGQKGCLWCGFYLVLIRQYKACLFIKGTQWWQHNIALYHNSGAEVMVLGTVCYLRVEQLGSLYLRQDRSNSSWEWRTTQRRVLGKRNKAGGVSNSLFQKTLLLLQTIKL